MSRDVDASGAGPCAGWGEDRRRTALDSERAVLPVLARGSDGSVRIGSFALAEQVLKSGETAQAGFNADLVRRLPQRNLSILFQDGEAHRRQRAAAAPFLAPATVATRYRPVITRLSRSLVEEFRLKGKVLLDEMTLALTAGVAAEIVGMTHSLRPGIGGRLSRIFELQSLPGAGWRRAAGYVLRAQWHLLGVYLIDVRPAIRARRKAPRPDLISSLIGRGWSPLDILTECITYGTAGISTTREFISLAALHFLAQDALRRRFLDGDDDERLMILAEILRLEPAVGTLLRRTTGPLPLVHDGVVEEIAPDVLVSIDVRSVNADNAVAGDRPHDLRPDRTTRGTAGLMSFGAGPHRCPGASIALQEAAIFLDHLLRVPGLRIETQPEISRNAASTGYVLRGFVLAAGP